MRCLITLTALAALMPLTVAAQPPAATPPGVEPGVERLLMCVPDDTDLVVVVPSLDALVAGVCAFGKAVGSDELAQLNVLDMLEDSLGDTSGAMDTAGPFALAMSADYHEPLLFVTLSSPDAWESTTKPTTLGQARLFEFEDRRFAAVTRNNVAILAREKADLQRSLKSAGKFAARLPEQARTMLHKRQAVLWVDVREWQPLVQQTMSFIAQTMYMGMAASGSDADVAIQVYKLVFEQFDELVSQTQTYTAALSINGRGLFIEQHATFDPDGALSRYLKKVRKPNRDLLRGLPTVGALAFASEWELPPSTVTFNEILAQGMLRMDALKEKIGAEQLDATLKRVREIHRNISGFNGVVACVPGGRGFMYYGLYMTEDGPFLQKTMRELFADCPELMSAYGPFPAGDLQHEPVDIGGVQADAYHINFNGEADRLQPMMQAMYSEDTTMYLAVHPEGCIYAVGPQDAARTAAAQLLTAQTPPLGRDPRVAAVFQQLSPRPQLCILVDIPEWFKMTSSMIEAAGGAFPLIDLGAKKLPLAAMTLYLQPQAASLELLVPTEPIRAIIEEIEELKGVAEEAH